MGVGELDEDRPQREEHHAADRAYRQRLHRPAREPGRHPVAEPGHDAGPDRYADPDGVAAAVRRHDAPSAPAAPARGRRPRVAATQLTELSADGPAARTACQLAACFTSSAICFSTALVSLTIANDVGHMAPSSSAALSWNPSVA